MKGPGEWPDAILPLPSGNRVSVVTENPKGRKPHRRTQPNSKHGLSEAAATSVSSQTSAAGSRKNSAGYIMYDDRDEKRHFFQRVLGSSQESRTPLHQDNSYARFVVI